MALYVQFVVKLGHHSHVQVQCLLGQQLYVQYALPFGQEKHVQVQVILGHECRVQLRPFCDVINVIVRALMFLGVGVK